MKFKYLEHEVIGLAKVRKDDNGEERVRRNFVSILEAISLTPNPNGGTSIDMNRSDWIRMDMCQAVIAEYVVMKDVKDTPTKRGYVLNAAVNLKEQNNTDFSVFIRVLSECVHEANSKPMVTYDVLFPLNVTRTSLQRQSFSAVGKTFRVLSWQTVKRKYDFAAMKERVRHHCKLDEKAAAVICTVEASSHQIAMQSAGEAFHLLRTCLNLGQIFGRYNVVYGIGHGSLGKIQNAQYAASFLIDGTFGDVGFLPDPEDVKIVALSENDLEQGKWFLKKLHPPKDEQDVMVLLVEAVQLYGVALDTRHKASAFLSFWQVLEVLTYRGESGYKIENLVKRVKTLLRDNLMLCDVLDICGQMRNRYAHRGEFTDDDMSNVSMLKAVVDRAFSTLFKIYPMFETWKELEAFYNSSAKPIEALREEQKILSSIVDFKSRTS